MFMLLTGIIVGLVGWINQSYIVAQWHWWTVMRPYAQAQIWPYVLPAEKEWELKRGDSFKECARDCPEMTVVPAGSFTMGASEAERQAPKYSNETPQHTVTLAQPFAVSKFDVTFADWDACVAGGGCDDYSPNDWNFGRGQRPTIDVNWADAQRYVAWLSRVTGKPYRLLSESEYEYVARGETTTIYPWGDNVTLDGKAMTNCGGCGDSQWANQKTAPVGSFPPNGFGLYDMVGNVWQWTEDCWHESFQGAPEDGAAWIAGGDCDNRVIRGGGWTSASVNVRSAIRVGVTATLRSTDGGFRVARALATR
jgi:formylglycine-generating enzyme required for sulfatase activity